MYNIYSPTVIKIEVLRLERRLDDELYYLRDAPQEYSTVPFDMEPEILPEESSVPLNKTSNDDQFETGLTDCLTVYFSCEAEPSALAPPLGADAGLHPGLPAHRGLDHPG